LADDGGTQEHSLGMNDEMVSLFTDQPQPNAEERLVSSSCPTENAGTKPF
jgi:hypothetical protein